MFCFQCEQTDRTGATPGCASAKGNCGKDATTADLQDLLVFALEGLATWCVRARGYGLDTIEADRFIVYGMFTTLTNVNFDAKRFVTMLNGAANLRDGLRIACANAGAPTYTGEPESAATWQPAPDLNGLLTQSRTVGILADADDVGEDVVGLRALLLYGLKGVCAYAQHACALGKERSDVYRGIEELLAFLDTHPTSVDLLLAKAMEIGNLNLKVMEMLDDANTGTFGAQRPGRARVSPVKGKAILVSGHDLGDLHELLEQTAGTGINVYTHGEMLPAHAYPVLNAYEHLVGNYGGAWQDQQSDFAAFPGPILMTSNCIIEPRPQYRQRIFTTGPVGWPGVRHITDHDFSGLIAAAKALPGFLETEPEESITVGFGRHAVLGVAPQVVEAVKAGAIRHFFLVGGCDGAAPGRNYYSDFATGVPDDTVVMTLGCNKYRFNRHAFGDIGGVPRLLDVGQCNDAYSAIRIATALADAFDCSVNELPLSLVVSWFEQKAAAVLLTLLALGIRNIRLGPTLPAFLTSNVVATLNARFGIRPIGDAQADIASCLARDAA
ncbi:hydroxylamine reductase [Paraburkholderia phymatum]|uniref:Hydroxylamine reductase n=1 Tax=Paraburkholderia phymatum (strain DSM 17167 / CIP 108236 / LMG 21445 / STM815) TaxID=391038 RepID=B2JWB4_PARP8|nr:hydroxylamine reductase [Paraburkholderia phymatum]ACC75241.1 hybrid cluster protein [Paraburkholderia phymatum STM815]